MARGIAYTTAFGLSIIALAGGVFAAVAPHGRLTAGVVLALLALVHLALTMACLIGELRSEPQWRSFGYQWPATVTRQQPVPEPVPIRGDFDRDTRLRPAA